MKYPMLDNVAQSKEMTTYFQGYSHTLSCQEGAFYDTKNITTEFYPILSPRHTRGTVRTFTDLQGIMDKEKLVWVDDKKLYVDGTAVNGISLTTGEKSMYKMGAYIVIFPDKVWYNADNGEYGNMESKYTLTSGSVSFTLCGADGSAITYHDDSYYASNRPTNGAYKMSTVNGKTSLQMYSSSTGLWASVATTYMKISATGIGAGLNKEDGVKISVDLTSQSWDYAENIFVNDDGSNVRSSTFVIADVGTDYITVTALLKENKSFTGMTIKVNREVPDMAFVTECQNRLWGCSKDGHEIYCCKLGDVKNWNCFAGISTDSWAATVGTDGKFTGAISYLGYPIFFKEDSLIRVSISSVGAHSYKDLHCRGVQSGSEKSLVILNELLYYKSSDGVCAYDGNFPTSISDALGEVRYKNAVGGSINNRYYVCMQDSDNVNHLFVYDKKHELWTHEDNVAVKFFCRNNNELYFVSGNTLYSINGSTETSVQWSVESGNIGYALTNKKYVSRFNVRMFLAKESHVSMYIQHDDGDWEFLFNMNGKGLKSFAIPVIPKRCDHFRYKLVGTGDCKLYSVSKAYEEGSDM